MQVSACGIAGRITRVELFDDDEGDDDDDDDDDGDNGLIEVAEVTVMGKNKGIKEARERRGK